MHPNWGHTHFLSDVTFDQHFIKDNRCNKFTEELDWHVQKYAKEAGIIGQFSEDKFDYDIILANINRNVIEKLLHNLTNIKSKIILSGLILSDLNRLKKLCNKLGVNSKDKMIGTLIFTFSSLKKLISSNRFIIKAKLKKTILVLIFLMGLKAAPKVQVGLIVVYQ